MADKTLSILMQYDLEMISGMRGRGSTVCVTDKGIYKVDPYQTSLKRLTKEYMLKEKLYQSGFLMTDRYLKNKEDELISYDRYKNAFTVKMYYQGRECDLTSKDDLVLAVKNLSKLHKTGSSDFCETRSKEGRALLKMERHNQELHRVKKYVKAVVKKKEFENFFLERFDAYYEQGMRVYDAFASYDQTKFDERFGLCHGAYHQHNILFTEEGIATVNFEHFYYDNQLLDLYLLCRKVLEKNRFSYDYYQVMIDAYDEELPLSLDDHVFLYAMLSYPEKFWKIANHYMNNKKSWISPKLSEKLSFLDQQEIRKKEFLSTYQHKYGIPFLDN